MVVEIVSEGLDVVDGLLSLGSSNVGLEENERDISLMISDLEVSNSLQFHGGLLLRIGDGRSVGHGSSSILILLQEDLGKDDIIKILELDREDNNASIRFGLQIEGLLISVSDLDQWSGLSGLTVRKDREEGSSKCVSLHESNFSGKFGSILRGLGQINLESNIVSRFSRGDMFSVLVLHDLIRSVFFQLAVAFDSHRDKKNIL